MKYAYPIVLTPVDSAYVVYVPDFGINTEGSSIEDALFMAKDAIGLLGIAMEDEGEELPLPSEKLPKCKESELATFVMVDFDDYRKSID